MIEACEIVARSFRITCQDARGLRAGATIAVLGGLCAERKASMATTAQGVDVGALTAAIREDVTDRLSTILVAGFEALEEDGRGLNQLQRSDLTQWALDSFDGLERSIAQKLVADLTRNGIEVWGLSTDLYDLMPNEGDDA
jgi:hypothetical protein